MFSWGKNTHGSSIPRATISRVEHLKSFINNPKLKPSTRRVNPNDDSTYDTVFQTRSENTLILRVHLSSSATPSMILVGVRVSHPWIDSNNRIIGFRPITSDTSWINSGLLLGDAVSQVVVHLQLNPPYVLEITDVNLKRMQVKSANATDNVPPAYDAVHSSNFLKEDLESNIDFDFEIPTSFPALEKMSRTEISQLITDPASFDDLASGLKEKEALIEFKSSITEKNLSLAKDNMKEKVNLNNLSKEVYTLTSMLENKLNMYEDLLVLQQESLKPFDPKEIKKKLVKEKKVAFDESEELANTWVEGENESSINDFIDQFLEKRLVHHKYAAKIELLSGN